LQKLAALCALDLHAQVPGLAAELTLTIVEVAQPLHVRLDFGPKLAARIPKRLRAIVDVRPDVRFRPRRVALVLYAR
jgi:hypothetical protein